MDTPEKALAIMHSFVMSDHFDDLIVYRLEKSLEWALHQLKDNEYDLDDMLDDIIYCRSLVAVLQGFSLNDYKEETATLNQINNILIAKHY